MMKILVAASPTTGESDDPLRTLGRMTAGVLHDLNNYLTVIGMTVEALAAVPTAADLQEARRALGHATALTRSVLDYVRGGTPELAGVDLAAIVRDAMLIAVRAISPAIDVFVVVGDTPARVRGAAPQLAQLVLNLALNAADAMPDGGVLSVTVWTTPERRVRLDVADTGGSVPVTGAAHGGSAWTTSTKRGGASGLGLGIVRDVAQLHRATFSLDVLAHGVTLATVVFPRLDDDPPGSA